VGLKGSLRKAGDAATESLDHNISFSGSDIIVTVFVRGYSELENGTLVNDF
jgi:hypothetical protein